MIGSRPHNPTADHIVIDDIWFYKESRGKYYLGNVPKDDGKRHPVRAHVYVWEKYYGAVPEGFSVHHIDKNPRNNDISNLTLMSYSYHSSLHSKEHADEAKERMDEVVRPKAIEWHKSLEGREWHKSHYEDVSRQIFAELVTKKCEVCGKEYQVSKSGSSRSKYCSSKCKNKSVSRKVYKDANKVPRVCPICGKTFLVYKYSHTVTCGRVCANISQSRKKTGVPRPHHQDS